MRNRNHRDVNRLAALIQVLSWTALFVVLADLAINFLFNVPQDPRVRPSVLAAYFDYGRSVEGKLRRSLSSDDEWASAIAVAGWIDRDCARTVPETSGRRAISFYGMSFSNQVGEALEVLDPTFKPVFFSGPGAPPNHTYRCFLVRERAGADDSEIQVFGILSSAVQDLLSMTGVTAGFESPPPFTYPRYAIGETGELTQTLPLVSSTRDWRRVLDSQALLRNFKAQLAAHDRFYDPLLFDSGWGDRSVIFRMLRRAYGQSVRRHLADGVLGPEGYRERVDIGPVLRAMVLDFATRSRSAGKRPVILLLQDGHGGDALFRLLGPTLQTAQIEYVSTHEVAPTTDPSNFIADGHFTAAANLRIAKRLQALLSCQPASHCGLDAHPVKN